MPVIINFKICDNCEDCNGIKICPVGAFHWDEENKTICVDDKKCINCGLCGTSCTNDAIAFVKTKEEAEELQKEIDNDPRTIADLFVERYGAMPINEQYTFEASEDKVLKRINSNRPVIIEFNINDNINCLLKSIPVTDIVQCYNKNSTYSKFIIDEDEYNIYNVKNTPCLKFYNKGEQIGEIVGYFDANNQDVFFDKIKNISAHIK